MALDKLKNLLVGEDDPGEEVTAGEEFYTTCREEYNEVLNEIRKINENF